MSGHLLHEGTEARSAALSTLTALGAAVHWGLSSAALVLTTTVTAGLTYRLKRYKTILVPVCQDRSLKWKGLMISGFQNSLRTGSDFDLVTGTILL